jgi:hypothetical protein
MMAFHNPHTIAATWLDPEYLRNSMDWRRSNERKQLAYERDRAVRRKQVGLVDTK